MNYIVVSGDSSGLGKLLSITLLEKGYGVVGLSRHSPESEKFPKNAPFFHFDLDLGDTVEIKSLYLKKIKGIGIIKGLVNNAAMAYDDLITNADPSRLEKMFRVNVQAPILLSKYILRDMLLKGVEGSFVHISSISAHTGYKGLSMYAATKGALESFSNGMAREWGGRGIRSNCVAPGFMETRMSATLSEEKRQKIYQRTCLKKSTDLSSVVETIVFLLSDQSRSITATTIHVDNGT